MGSLSPEVVTPWAEPSAVPDWPLLMSPYSRPAEADIEQEEVLEAVLEADLEADLEEVLVEDLEAGVTGPRSVAGHCPGRDAEPRERCKSW